MSFFSVFMSFLSFIFCFNVTIKLRNSIPDGVSTALYTAHTVDTIYTLLLNSRVWLLCMDAASRIKLWPKQLKTAEIRRFERPKLVETCLKVPTFDCEKENPKDLLKVVLSPKDWKVLSLTRAGQHWEPTRGKETNHVPAWNCDSQ